MTHVAHELSQEFPDASMAIAHLRESDAHFARLADRHHALNREIHRIESGAEAASDQRVEALKKERLSLLDALSALIAKGQRAMPHLTSVKDG
ncbi:MAG: DUF465 domain-containing protein [Sphingopyxis sp.]